MAPGGVLDDDDDDAVFGNSRIDESDDDDEASDTIKYFELVPYSGGQSLRVNANNDKVSIGRNDGCDICWSEAYISRWHATLIGEQGRLFVIRQTKEDKLIRVNGQEVLKDMRRELQLGDQIDFANQPSSNKSYIVRGSTRSVFITSSRVRKKSIGRRSDPIILDDDDDEKSPVPKKPRLVENTSNNTKIASQISTKSIMEDLECVICQDLMAYCHILPCGHLGCGACLLEWLRRGNGCPECRENVKSGTILAPVVLIDRLVDKHKHLLSKEDLDDFHERCCKWRRLHPKDANGPVTAPKQNFIPAQSLAARGSVAGPQLIFPGRASSQNQSTSHRPLSSSRGPVQSVRDIRSHFTSNLAPRQSARIPIRRPPAAPVARPSGSIRNALLNSINNLVNDNNDNVIDLSSS